VFVFDGGAPEIKKRAISGRRERKRRGGEDMAKTAEKLLAAQLREAAVKEAQKYAMGVADSTRL
jgi:DNA excision repair protein ERCC-5